MQHGIRPLLKKLYFVRRVKHGTAIRIGETVPGRAMEMEDEDGTLARLLTLMDGTRTIDQIYEGWKREGAEETKQDLEDIIVELDELGLLDDASAAERSGLDSIDQERYKANLHYFSLYSIDP